MDNVLAPPNAHPVKFINQSLSAIIYLGIRFYQKFINPVLKFFGGPNTGCRFHPTCSNYFMQAVRIHGPWRGSWLGIWRILRCHPWGGQGEDPVPPKRN